LADHLVLKFSGVGETGEGHQQTAEAAARGNGTARGWGKRPFCRPKDGWRDEQGGGSLKEAPRPLSGGPGRGISGGEVEDRRGLGRGVGCGGETWEIQTPIR